MTREEAAAFFQEDGERTVKSMRNFGWSMAEKRKIAAYNIALSALRGPQPDPKTGLVPCGCGGKAELGRLEYTIADPDLMPEFYAYCQDCGLTTENSADRELVENAWNRAMGRKGGAE